MNNKKNTNNNEYLQYIVTEEDINMRIDTFVSKKDEKLSRTLVQNLIKEGKILLNGKNIKSSTKVELNQVVLVPSIIQENVDRNIIPENIHIDIIFEDNDILVINKPKDMVVHPAIGNLTGTLVNAIVGRNELSSLNGEGRPGIIHRLDKNTTGVLVVAKNNYAHLKIADQIQKRITKKIYIALVKGVIGEQEGIIDMPIGRHQTNRKKMAVRKDGKEALTKFKVLKRYSEGYTLVEIELKTGRTHQIRVHMAHIGYPIVGDDVYSNGKNPFGINSQMLHSYKLGFVHPTKNEWVEFEAPVPEEFKKVLNSLD